MTASRTRTAPWRGRCGEEEYGEEATWLGFLLCWPNPMDFCWPNPMDKKELLFLYLTNEVEFGQDILQDCVSSYHLHV